MYKHYLGSKRSRTAVKWLQTVERGDRETWHVEQDVTLSWPYAGDMKNHRDLLLAAAVASKGLLNAICAKIKTSRNAYCYL